MAVDRQRLKKLAGDGDPTTLRALGRAALHAGQTRSVVRELVRPAVRELGHFEHVGTLLAVSYGWTHVVIGC